MAILLPHSAGIMGLSHRSLLAQHYVLRIVLNNSRSSSYKFLCPAHLPVHLTALTCRSWFAVLLLVLIWVVSLFLLLQCHNERKCLTDFSLSTCSRIMYIRGHKWHFWVKGHIQPHLWIFLTKAWIYFKVLIYTYLCRAQASTPLGTMTTNIWGQTFNFFQTDVIYNKVASCYVLVCISLIVVRLNVFSQMN